jgi:MYXO-CTERM domain-containing protein
VAEVCGGDGETPVVCPPDLAVLEGTACGGPASGDCDVQDTCVGAVGATALCQARVQPGGTLCRLAAGACDVPEQCDGVTRTCPLDRFAIDDTSCSDGVTCNGLELCRTGLCQPAAPLLCDDLDACTADACAEPGGCRNTRIAGCCNVDGECADDGDVCTAERCSGSGGTCQHLPIAGCCTRDADCTGGGGCVAVSCNLGTHRCEPHTAPGCCASDADCSDGVACTRDLCDRVTGACSNPAVMGCCVGAGDCSDGDSCTADRCDIVGSASSGTCAATAIAGCCRADADCSDSDGDLCTSPSCNTSTERCIETPVSCDDADACTADFCEIDGSCSHLPIMGCGGTDGGMTSMDDAGAGGMDAGAGGDMDAALPDAGFTNDAASLRTDAPVDAGRLDRVDAGLAGEDAGDLTLDDTSGCHCAVPSPAGSSRGLWVGLGIVALALSRRRRAR